MRRSSGWLAVVLGLLLACCCACLALAVLGGVGGYLSIGQVQTQVGPMLTQAVPYETMSAETPTAEPVPVVVRTPVPTPAPGSADTLTALENDQVPAADLRALAVRFRGVPDVPQVVSDTPAHYAPGDTVKFWLSNEDTNQHFQVDARLAYTTQNVYFFVENGVQARQSDIQNLVDEFQNKAYPTDRDYFGSEWTPGVDGDPHLYILDATGVGSNVGGYFDDRSEYSRLANPYSNEKEIFVLNGGSGTPLSDPYWAGTLAHEFQHMIRWYHHPNDDLWMNEGFSQLAQSINGYEVGNESTYMQNPDLQLNTWTSLSSSPMETVAHYGAAYLFQQYFLDRLGKAASQALAADPKVGLDAVDDTLKTLDATEPGGQPLTTEQLFADWTVANLLNDPKAASGQYAYATYRGKVTKRPAIVRSCPQAPLQATVHQFGAAYIDIRCTGTVTISFTGSLQTQVVEAQPHSGRYAFWSNRKDSSDTTLTREFDLTGVKSATLDYWAWWQIEKDYDFAYVDASDDGGKTWTILKTPSGTDSNPTGNNLGWGYTGCSGGGDPGKGCTANWVEERVDLSAYAGKKVLVRFEYITDEGQNYESLLLDDIRVPELNYQCDLETDACGWDAHGFVRMDDVLPQTFAVQVVHQSGGQTTVQPLPLDASEQGSLTLDLKPGDKTVLEVSGTTRFTEQLASYEYEVK
jgi:immune inhibitor A